MAVGAHRPGTTVVREAHCWLLVHRSPIRPSLVLPGHTGSSNDEGRPAGAISYDGMRQRSLSGYVPIEHVTTNEHSAHGHSMRTMSIEYPGEMTVSSIRGYEGADTHVRRTLRFDLPNILVEL
jgi:hypothetical protein